MARQPFLVLLSLLLTLAAAHDHGSVTRKALHARQGRPAASSVTLHSTNPTAVPVASITSLGEFTPSAQLPIPTQGSKPPGIRNAPALPDLKGTFAQRKYPPPDQIPPTDSPEVQSWLAEIANSGIDVPDYSPTTDPTGSCVAPANNPFVSAGRCWWSCDTCLGEHDVEVCEKQNDWGLTFDDGPGKQTDDLLAYLDSENIKATFFIVGSRCLTKPETVQYEYISGHQVASHTWSHKALTTLTNEQIVAELGWTSLILTDITGVKPAFFRPPYGDIDDRVRAIALAMGMKAVMWSRPDGLAFNTQDFDVHVGSLTANEVFTQWERIVEKGLEEPSGFITLAHDLYIEHTQLAEGYIIPDGVFHGFKPQAVISCQGMPLANAYIETNDNRTNPHIATLGIGGGGVTGPLSGAVSLSVGKSMWVAGFAALAMGLAGAVVGI